MVGVAVARGYLALACTACLTLATPSYNPNMEEAQALIASGGDLDATDADGNALLARCIRDGQYETTEVMLDAGANPELKDSNGKTALFAAIDNGHPRLVRLLASKGANLEALRDGSPLTPLQHSIADGHIACTDVLLDFGADTAVMNEHSATPLHEATRNGHSELVQALVDHDADGSAVDKHGLTPLYYAAANRRVKQVVSILSSVKDVEGITRLKDCRGLSALAAAAVNFCVECVHLMIDAGSKVTILGDILPDYSVCPMTEPIDQTMDVGVCRTDCYTHGGFTVGDLLTARKAYVFLDEGSATQLTY